MIYRLGLSADVLFYDVFSCFFFSPPLLEALLDDGFFFTAIQQIVLYSLFYDYCALIVSTMDILRILLIGPYTAITTEKSTIKTITISFPHGSNHGSPH